MDSILITTKKLLGIDAEYHDFDMDIIVSINSVLMALNQMGIGVDGFAITGDDELWTDFVDTTNLMSIKSYVYLRVRMIFDPPTTPSIAEAYNNQIKEFEWRMYVHKDNENYVGGNDD